MAVYNYAKIFLFKAYIAVYKFDIICISETYLDTSITSNDGNLEMLCYNLVRADHPPNNKYSGVCIYHKSAQRVLNIHYLQESISFELKIGDKFCNFISLHRSPSQTEDENLKRYLNHLSQSNTFLVVVIEDFNVPSINWYYHDKSSSVGNAADAITKQYGLLHVIKEPIQ